MKNRVVLILSVLSLIFITGCSWTPHKRGRDKTDLNDKETETKFQLRGPKAVLKHEF